MRLALGQRLQLLPAPAESLRLSAERLGPPHAGARALFEDKSAERAARLREAVRQARAAAGPEAALRVLAVDPDSRVPERRSVLTPFEVCDPRSPAASAFPGRPASSPAAGGRPLDVDGHEVVGVRESWLIEDRWWTRAPSAAPLLGGRDDRRARPVVFRDLVAGAWFRHR